MELKDNCKVLLDNNKTQKVNCYLFKNKVIKRELALHVNIDYKSMSTISDVKTGYRLCGIPKEASKVKQEDINEALDTFIKHFTKEEIQKRFVELDEQIK